jgi:hypothetical protein
VIAAAFIQYNIFVIRSAANIAVLSLFAVASLYAQTSAPANATVIFTLDFPQSTPAHYWIRVDSSGRANYESEAPKTPVSSDQNNDSGPYRYDFVVTPATRDRIFELAARAKYFSGSVDSTKHHLANTGAKTLAYKDSQHAGQARFNYSTNPEIQQLTTLFQSLSSTLEYGQRLDYAYHYQKLALDEELKSLSEAARQNGLVEIQALAPILKKIADDHSVINVTRARAEKLLAQSSPAINGSH